MRYTLGLAYMAGDGVPLDVKEGVIWMQLAADQKLAAAEYALADASRG